MKLLDIGLKDLVRSIRSAFFWMFGFGIPLLMVLIFYFAFGGLSSSDEGVSLPTTPVAVVNLDRPVPEFDDVSAGRMLADLLSMDGFDQLLDVTSYDRAKDARQAVDRQEAAVAVIIPPDFTATVFGSSGQTALELYQDPTLTIGPGVVEGIINQFLNAFVGSKIAVDVATEALSARGLAIEPGQLEAIADQYAEWASSTGGDLQPSQTPHLEVRLPAEQAAEGDPLADILGAIMAGMMVFYAFFTGAASSMTILQEAEGGTLSRMFTTPTRRSTILGGKFVTVFLTVIFQVVVLIAVSALIFGIQWGDPVPLAVAATSLVLLAASFGIFITSLLQGTQQTGIVYGGVMTVMGMIGMSQVFMMGAGTPPPAMEILPLVVPQGWAVRALDLVMGGGGLGNLLLPVAVMGGLSVILFFVGVFQFRKRFV